MSFFKRKVEHNREESSSTGDSRFTTASGSIKDGSHLKNHQSKTANEPNHRNTMQLLESASNQSLNSQRVQAGPSNQIPAPNKQQMPSYPWSTRQLILSPGTTPSTPNTLISPFPRYGLSLPPIPTQSGHLLIFGGLVRESVRNDLFALDCHDFSASPVHALGDIPIARVGHASALVRSVLLVWGGDTKNRIDEPQDEAIYLFNIHTREWTKILAEGYRPKGRYGHAVAMHANTLFVSGGQSDGLFMDDLWAFDLSTLMAGPTWQLIQPEGQSPSPRTGHVLITHRDNLYLFGGTDGAFHYNDTWCFDLHTRIWTELQCIGYIPVPREGHSAALVDDVMYVFGGRDINGKDLGDLAAFKITNSRWYTFQNMGPAPSGRSGHAMAAFGKQIFVLGGDSNAAFAQPRADDPNVLHVLDTSKIKYPPDAPRVKATQRQQEQAPSLERKPSLSDIDFIRTEDHKSHFGGLASVQPQASSIPPFDDLQQREVEPHISLEDSELSVQQSALPSSIQATDPEISPSAIVDLGSSPRSGLPPQRPRRADDEVFAQQLASRSLSPVLQRIGSPDSQRPSYAESGNIHINGKQNSIFLSDPMGHPEDDQTRRTGPGTGSRLPPADAFYYGTRSPTGTVFSTRPDTPRLSSDDKKVSAETAVLRAILQQAVNEGYTPTSALLNLDEVYSAEDPERLLQEILALQEQCVTLKSELENGIIVLTDDYSDAEALSKGAMQECAYLRARLAFLENEDNYEENPETIKLREMEQILSTLVQDKSVLEDEVEHLQDTIKKLSTDLADIQGTHRDAVDRAIEMEKKETQLRYEVTEIQDKSVALDSQVRDHISRHASVSVLLQKRDAEIEQHTQALNEIRRERADHILLIQETKEALKLAEIKASALESTRTESVERSKQLEDQLDQLRLDNDRQAGLSRTLNLKIQELETTLSSVRTDADTYRKISEGGLSRLLSREEDQHKAKEASKQGEGDANSALIQECASLHKMLNEAGAQIDSAQSTMMQHRQEIRIMAEELQSLRDVSYRLRHQSQTDTALISRLRDTVAVRDNAARQYRAKMSESQARSSLMRGLLADHGIAIDNTDASQLLSNDQTIRLQDQDRQLEEARLQLKLARDQITGLEVSTLKRDSQTISPSSHSKDSRIAELEQKLAEIDDVHRKKLQQVESDYQTAVRYVKGTEKVFRRMKDELTKQKNANAALQAELGSSNVMPSTDSLVRSRGMSSGRVTPDFDPARQQQRLTTQNADLQRQLSDVRQELGALRDICAGREKEVEITRKRAAEAENRLHKLEKERQGSDERTWDDIQLENADLRQENEVLNHQVMLLLADDDASNSRPRSHLQYNNDLVRRRSSSSQGSEDHRNLTEEMREWHQGLSPPVPAR